MAERALIGLSSCWADEGRKGPSVGIFLSTRTGRDMDGASLLSSRLF